LRFEWDGDLVGLAQHAHPPIIGGLYCGGDNNIRGAKAATGHPAIIGGLHCGWDTASRRPRSSRRHPAENRRAPLRRRDRRSPRLDPGWVTPLITGGLHCGGTQLMTGPGWDMVTPLITGGLHCSVCRFTPGGIRSLVTPPTMGGLYILLRVRRIPLL
jgi:hypothetical protein